MIFALLVLVVALAVALVCVAAAMLRVFRNVGVLDLEDYARRRGLVYIPVQRQLAEQLEEWSKPTQVRLDTKQHPLLVEMQFRTPQAEATGDE